MKKILVLAVITVFVIMPLGSFAQTAAVSDSDLGTVFAQSGLITITFENITVKSKALGTTSSDLLDFWGKEVTGNSYIGYADVFVTGGLVERSGTLTMEVVDNDNPDVLSHCQLNAHLYSVIIKADLGIDATIKLGTDPTLAGTQILGRAYMAGFAATLNGAATVYAHNY